MIAEAPSKATSLSIFEMNYLLNKTKEVECHASRCHYRLASLEVTCNSVYKNKVGILPVVDNDQDLVSDRGDISVCSSF